VGLSGMELKELIVLCDWVNRLEEYVVSSEYTNEKNKSYTGELREA
jgi:hypothetical protein